MFIEVELITNSYKSGVILITTYYVNNYNFFY